QSETVMLSNRKSASRVAGIVRREDRHRAKVGLAAASEPRAAQVGDCDTQPSDFGCVRSDWWPAFNDTIAQILPGFLHATGPWVVNELQQSVFPSRRFHGLG